MVVAGRPCQALAGVEVHRRKAWVVEEERRRSEAWEVVGEHRSMAWVVAAAVSQVRASRALSCSPLLTLGGVVP